MMRALMTLIIALLVSVVPVFAQSAADEAAIRKAHADRVVAWNAKDVKAYLPFLDKGCKNAFNGNPCGAGSMENGEFQEWAKNAKIKILEEKGVDFITPDIALYRYTAENSGGLDADGKPQPPTKVESARVFVKKNGKWLVAVGGIGRPIED